MVSSIHRLAVAVLLLTLFFVAISETSGNPAPTNDVNSVADAIRYLQDLENKHQFARPRSRSIPEQYDGVSINALIMILDHLDKTHSRTPRFGKRANDYLTKEYTNNMIRYLLENPPEVNK